MALFGRKEVSHGENQPLYTIGSSKTLLIVGLGNPGAKYAANRHNLGFMVLDKYRTTHDFSGWITKKDLNCIVSDGLIGDTKVYLVKPMTYMNDSGRGVAAAQSYWRIYNTDTVVVHDELDLDFGAIRTKIGGSSAGHNGIKSVSQAIGEDFGRIRIGIGPQLPPRIDSADFVLQDFTKEEQKVIHKIINEACSLLDERTAGKLPEITIKV